MNKDMQELDEVRARNYIVQEIGSLKPPSSGFKYSIVIHGFESTKTKHLSVSQKQLSAIEKILLKGE